MADETNETEEQAPEETPVAEEATEAAAPEAAAEPETPAEPEEQLSPKERRRRTRAAAAGAARPQRTVEERVAERAEARKRKATHRRAYRAKVREKAAAKGPVATPLAAEPAGTGRAKTRQGIVVSDKANKTITVRIDMARRHRTYKKIVRTSTTLHVHDEANDARAGDTVRVVESRPLSRMKRWRLVEILERAR